MSLIRTTLSAACVAGLVVLSGCTDSSAAPSAPQTTVTVQASEPAEPSGSGVPGDAGDTAEPTEPSPTASEPAPSAEPTPTSAPTEQPFSVRPGSVSSKPVKASVFPVERAGQLATVNVLIAADDPLATFGVGASLSDQDPEVGSRSKDSVDGLRLVDPVNKKSYLPATTGNGVCACTPADDAIPMFTSSLWVSVVFAAPPADQTTINVVIPRFGTVTDVPLV